MTYIKQGYSSENTELYKKAPCQGQGKIIEGTDREKDKCAHLKKAE